jgi:23S rRNA pseudouridine2605 synthase
MAVERLQKILARAGVASRRAAEGLIVGGHVRVNGRVVTELGVKADPRRDRVEVDGTRLVAQTPVYVVLHKPRGVISTMSDPEGRLTVRDLLKELSGRVYPVGRLDYATSGVLLATNDGDFAEALLHPKKQVPKTYVLKVSGLMAEADVERWRKGVRLEDGMTSPARVSLLRHEGDKSWIELTIHEGRNQQIRRMGEATGFTVMRLARVAVAGITTEGLRPGQWRELTREELQALRKEYGVPSHPGAGVQPASGARRGVPGPRTTKRGGRRPDDAPASPRYGGGAPGRRGYEVKDDWGGGAGRGRTSQEEGGADVRGGRSDLGRGSGRGGWTRTTGSGGGVGGASDGSYRISKTRRG